MKLCYCDETGTGEEPYAVLLGVVVDATRMHVTKDDWADFLRQLSEIVGQEFHELHTRNFYSGSGIWKNLTGPQRSEVIDFFINWFADRKHHVVFSAIDKAAHKDKLESGELPEEINTVWKAMGFHVALAIQKYFQGEQKNKGNTIFIFDEEVKEETRFQKLILNPPEWSDNYYGKTKKQKRLCQIVDAPYFADSKNVGLLQVADFLAYFVRRYIEIAEGDIPEKYKGEGEKIKGWFSKIKARSIPYQSMYPKKQRSEAADVF
ncbi:DUF3800 domain-containing protein [Uliginosibacterium sp. TH139]|uniref:DUF3800 domain-containing protein n=1 Tax=Uliginosibacterium sp. TH139 TaxID=2067453 RepID=UPI000C7B508D|nr:DUF3800 domain-containing protein [Uliginosibacterium sp. TH139]PLK50667.1 hypothetical protein C0V76_02305 [Uliginosibacterium sp. TH139]